MFAVKGLMHEAPLETPLNPRSRADLKRLFRHYLDGDTILPR